MDRYTAVQTGLVEVFLGPTGAYFTSDVEARDIIDGFVSIFEACELREASLDGETQEAISKVIEVKVKRLKEALKVISYD